MSPRMLYICGTMRGLQNDRSFALGPVQYPPALWVECIPAMHDAAVVPDQDISNAPLMVPAKFGLGGMSP